MFKKWKIFVLYASYGLTVSQGASLSAMLWDEKNDVSFYGPSNRGFSSIQTLSFKDVEEGPQDKNFTLSKNCPSVSKGHFSFQAETQYGCTDLWGIWRSVNPFLNSAIKDGIHAIGVARLTVDSYKAVWPDAPWDDLQIHIEPHDSICRGGERNAYYERIGTRGGRGKINFCASSGNVQIFDVVSHEAGHGILDLLNERYYGKNVTHPCRAFHESFGDLSSFFATLHLARRSNEIWRIRSIIQNEDNVCFAPGLRGKGLCLVRKEERGSCEAHGRSGYFTRFFLRSMNRVLKLSEFVDIENPTHVSQVALFFQKALIQTAVETHKVKSLYDFGSQIVKNVSALFSRNTQNESLVSQAMKEELGKMSSDLKQCIAA